MRELSEELETLKNIEHKLNELLRWTKFAGMQQLRNILVQALGNDDAAALAYEFSDGARGTREVAQIAGISHNTVAVYWRKWSRLGIVEPSSTYQGRYQRICSLEEVGLVVPPLPQPSGNNQGGATPEVEKNE